MKWFRRFYQHATVVASRTISGSKRGMNELRSSCSPAEAELAVVGMARAGSGRLLSGLDALKLILNSVELHLVFGL